MKVLVVGCDGKMGQPAVVALEKAGFECIGCRRGDSLKDMLDTQPDVMLDLTEPAVVFEHANLAIEANVPAVIGTSGLTKDQIKKLELKASGKKSGMIIAPNFALGAILMMKFSKVAKDFFPSVEIVEGHHPQKKDIPSGTARMTADLIGKDVKIHSRRQPGLIAEQAVYFGGIGESLTIKHATTDRSCFMPGIVFAVKKVLQIKSLIIGLEPLIDAEDA